jgi:hypothetical protein
LAKYTNANAHNHPQQHCADDGKGNSTSKNCSKSAYT